MEPRSSTLALRLPPAAVLVVAGVPGTRAWRRRLLAGLATDGWASVRLLDRAAAGRLLRIDIPHR